MSLLKTMIKHTAGGQEASAGCEPPSLPPQQPQPAIYVSTGLDVHESRTPATGLKTGRSTARCVAACRLNTLHGYVPACSRPKPRTRPESSRGCLEHAAEAIQRPAGAGHPGVRQGTPAGGTALFFPKNYQPPRFVEPGRNPSKFPERTGFIREPSLEM